MSADGLFVVVVDFTVKPEKAEEFSRLLNENAEKSRTEEVGCVQFDVCQPDGALNQFFLYELYQSPAAFKVHLDSAHFKSFDAQVQPWIMEKTVRTFTRRAP
jgi:autoinducer 2-degrading protein